ncbi:MAG: sulfite exporter TauE/SafE family protein [Porticoccaceae bacterium]
MLDFLIYILAGGAVGVAIGLTGVGGGSLMTPLLILFGFPYHVAIGTDLLYAGITKAGGIVPHHRQRSISWPIVFWLAAGSIPASLLTATLLSRVFEDPTQYQVLLTRSLGLMLMLTGLVVFLREHFIGNRPSVNSSDSVKPSATKLSWTLLMGVVLGVFVTLSSVGAGAVCAAFLMLLYPHLPAIKVVGTDIVHAVPLTLIAGLGHLIILGNVDFVLLAGLLIGSLPAITLASRFANRIPNTILQRILATLLLGLGVKFFIF